MQFEWKIILVGPVETIGENATPKQTVVLEEVTDRDYPASLAVDFWKDKTEMLQWFGVGDVVKVWLNSRAREHNGRHFNSISVWRMEALNGSNNGGGRSSSSSKSKSDDVDDDLPF